MMPVILKTCIFVFLLSIPTLSFNPLLYHLATALGVVATSIFLFTVLFLKRKVLIPRESLLFTTWLIIASASSLYAACDLNASIVRIVSLIQIDFLIILLFNVCNWERSIKILLVPIALAALVNLGFAHIVDEELRSVGLLDNANMFGYLMVVGIFSIMILCLIRIQTKGGLNLLDWVLIASSIGLSYGLVMSGSKKALLALLFIMLAVTSGTFFKLKRKILKFSVTLALMACLAVLFVHSFSQTAIFARVQESLDFFRQEEQKGRVVTGSTDMRYAYIIAGVQMFLANPLFGIGLDNFAANVERYSPKFGLKPAYSHCNYIEVLASSGLLGFVIYFSIYASIFHRLYRKWRNGHIDRWRIPLAISFLYILFSDFASVTYYDKIFWIWMSGMAASSTFDG